MTLKIQSLERSAKRFSDLASKLASKVYYDPDQPRDEDGQWSDGGGGGGGGGDGGGDKKEREREIEKRGGGAQLKMQSSCLVEV